jgi:MarR family transcriptional regulator, lower aerobic nicotinate degradation pathway regulator
MYSRSAPARLRSLPSWLLQQSSLTASHLVTDRLAALAEHRYQFSMLAALDEFGPLSQADLGRRCGLDRSDVAAAVADLHTRGMLDRRPDPHDRRRNVVQITEAGEQHLHELDQLIATAQEDLLAPLSPVERQLLVELLRRLTEHHADPG